MNKTEFEEIKAIELVKAPVTVKASDFSNKECLAYGVDHYNKTILIFVIGLNIVKVRTKLDVILELESKPVWELEELIPSKGIYWQHSSAEFCQVATVKLHRQLHFFDSQKPEGSISIDSLKEFKFEMFNRGEIHKMLWSAEASTYLDMIAHEIFITSSLEYDGIVENLDGNSALTHFPVLSNKQVLCDEINVETFAFAAAYQQAFNTVGKHIMDASTLVIGNSVPSKSLLPIGELVDLFFSTFEVELTSQANQNKTDTKTIKQEDLFIKADAQIRSELTGALEKICKKMNQQFDEYQTTYLQCVNELVVAANNE
nr:conserved hypothetical protein [Vibrio chagasii]